MTESGLSITKWEVVTGTLPPMSEKDWIEEFELYKETPQYSSINKGMSLGDFKFIYFWEYIHRLWARVMGLVFIIPFVIFLVKKEMDNRLLRKLSLVFLLACLAATFGWIMVASGLIKRPWVNAYKLSIHLLIAFAVYVSLFWTWLFSISTQTSGKKILGGLISLTFVLVVFQIFLGGVMAGMKAALVYPTWPEIGTEYMPSILMECNQWTWDNFNNYDKGLFMSALVHFGHRMIAYILLITGLFLSYKLIKTDNKTYNNIGFFLSGILLLQVILGIITVINSKGNIPVLWGVLHQGLALILLSCVVYLVFYNRKNIRSASN